MFPIKDSIRIPFAPVVTYGLILINALVFLYQASLGQQEAIAFSYEHALVPRRYFDPNWALAYGLSPTDYLPFIEGTFMHGGWWHLILNMWTLFIFGSSLEGRIGRSAIPKFLSCLRIKRELRARSLQPGFGRAGAWSVWSHRGRARRIRHDLSARQAHHFDPHRHHPAFLQGSRAFLRAHLVWVSIRAGLH